jgi:hypothetical protein
MPRGTSCTTRAWPNGPEPAPPGWQVFGSWARISRVQPDATLPPAVSPEPAQVAEPRQRSGLLWWVVVACVTVAAVVVAGVVLALQPSAPSSVDELRSLLITPTGQTLNTTKVNIDGRAPRQGARWTVSQGWIDSASRDTVVVSLTQYESADQARTALARVADQTPGTHLPISGYPGAFYVPGSSVPFLGKSLPATGGGTGAKHTIVVFMVTTGETSDLLPHLLTEQLDRLP